MVILSGSELVRVASSLFCLALILGEGHCIIFSEEEISINVRLESLISISIGHQNIRAVNTILEADEEGSVNFDILPTSRNKYGDKDGSSRAVSSAESGCPNLGIKSKKNIMGVIFIMKMRVPSPPVNYQIHRSNTGTDEVWRYDCDYTVIAHLLPNQHQGGNERVHSKSARLPFKISVDVLKTKDDANVSRSSIMAPNQNYSSSLQNREACFDGMNKVTFQIFENNPRSILTSFGFFLHHIKRSDTGGKNESSVQYDIYGLSSEKIILKIKQSRENGIGSKFDIWISSDLDREDLTEYTFNIKCTVSLKVGSESFELPGSLKIFDENDNGPMWSADQPEANKSTIHKTIYFLMDHTSLENRRLEPDQGHIAFSFYDKDTSLVNHYQSYIMNDTKQLLEISQIKYDINIGQSSPPKKVAIFLLKAVLKRNPTNGWDDNYCVLIILNDHSIIGGKKAQVSFNLCLYYKNWKSSKMQLSNNNDESTTGTGAYEVFARKRKQKVNTTIGSDTKYLNLEARVDEVSSGQDGSMCDSECVNWIIGVAVLVMTVILTLALALCFIPRHHSRKNSESHKHDIECGENTASEINSRKILTVGSWPIKNGTLCSIGSDIVGSENLQMESSVQGQGISNDNNGIDSDWIIPPSLITIKTVIGNGNFGQVCHAVYKKSGELPNSQGLDVAVKLFKESQSQTERESLLTEYETLKDLSHPHVVKLIGVVLRKSVQSLPKDLLVLEYAELKSLKSFLEKCRIIEINDDSPRRRITDTWLKRFSESLPSPAEQGSLYSLPMEQIMDFSLQIADGMEYISSMRIVHRDLAARNILLTSNKVCKITDFGLSRDVYLNEAYVKLSDESVPAKWLAPECFAIRKYTYQSDVWAFGILLWELATKGMSPYEEERVEPLYLYQYLKQGSRLTKPLSCSKQLYAVMEKCWEFEPLERPTFQDLVQMLKSFTEKEDQDQEVNEVYYNQLELEKESHQSQSHGEMLPKDRKCELNFHGLRVSFASNTYYGYKKGKREADSLNPAVQSTYSVSNSGELDPVDNVAFAEVEGESRNKPDDDHLNLKMKPLLPNPVEVTRNEKEFISYESPSVIPAKMEVQGYGSDQCCLVPLLEVNDGMYYNESLEFK